ncbi:MAG: T9SS type B sorting domain-containing protein [Paludibacteraceae bacterium]|nr:T9SS type B sorting domain-containing protein [Paludibacteraceae bacterium]
MNISRNRVFLCLLTLLSTGLHAQTCDITQPEKEICKGDNITLTCTTTADTYEWSPGGATTKSITISPGTTTSYSCKATKKGGSTDTDNLISAGDFEFAPTDKVTSEQNKMGDWIKYEYTNWDISGKDIGFGCTTSARNANNVKTAYFAQCPPQHGSWLMVCDGGQSSGTKIWQARDLKLKKGVTYEFRCYASNIDLEYAKHGVSSLAKIKFCIESDEGNKDITNWEYVGNTAGGDLGKWKLISGTYTPTKDLNWAHISIYNSCTETEGNDFAIDNIYFGNKTSTEDVVTTECVTVKVKDCTVEPPTVTLTGTTVCPDKQVTLTPVIGGGPYSAITWYKNGTVLTGETSETLTITSPSTFSATDTYKIKLAGTGGAASAESSADVKTYENADVYITDKVERGKPYKKNGFDIPASETEGKNQIKKSKQISECATAYLTLNIYGKETVRACYGAPLTVTALTKGGSYQWNYEGLTTETITITQADAFLLECMVTFDDGNISIDSITVTADVHPGVNNPKTFEECAGDGPYSINIEPNPSPENYKEFPDKYFWSPKYRWAKNGEDIGETTEPILDNVYFPKTIGGKDEYVLTMTNGLCSEPGTMILISKACRRDPINHILKECQVEKGEITLKPDTEGLEYLWNDGSTNPTLSVGISTPGIYQFKCIIKTSDIEGTDQEENFTLTVNPVKSQEFSDRVLVGTELTKYGFTFSAVETARPGEIVKTKSEKTTQGCDSIVTFTLTVYEIRPIEPMVYFSPNGDGINDLWLIKNIEFHPTAVIQIFDRYHKLLYTCTASEFKGWDGKYNGHDVVRDDYWFIISGESLEKTISGHFALKR